MLLVAIAVVAVVAVLAGYVLISDGSLVTRDRSAETFPVGAGNYGKKFGHGDVDIECAKSCSFSFQHNDGRAVLGYAAGMIGDKDQIEILLNGRPFGLAPQTGDGWMRGLGIPLPGDALKPGTLNVISFINRPNSGKLARWAVSFVKVTEESLPTPNVDKAREFAEMGGKKFLEKDVAPGNLYQSLVYMRSAKDYMEKLEPKPGLYYEVSRKIDTVSKELQEQFDKLMFTARKAMQFSDRGRAAEALEKILRVFPDAEDQRHQEARQLLDGMK